MRLGIVALLLLAAGSARAAEPFDIDVILPLTGSAAFLGSTEQVALQRAEKAFAAGPGIGGRPVRFVFHDDQSSPQVAVQLATQVASAKPAVVIGSGVVAMCNAMAPLMRRGPVMYCLSPGIYPAPGGFVFSGGIATHDLAATQIRYFRSRGLLRLAIITSTDASGQDAARQLKEVLALPENHDMTVVAETTFNPTDVSTAAQVQRLKAADPQAVIAWSTGAGIGTVFKGLQDSGLDVPVATTNGNMTFAAMDRYADILPRELYIPSAAWPPSDRSAADPVKQRFYAAFDPSAPPDAASTFAWDPAQLIVAALQQLGPEATAEQLRDHLAKLTGVEGVNGRYDFQHVPQRGLDDSDAVVTKWSRPAHQWEIVSQARGVPF